MRLSTFLGCIALTMIATCARSQESPVERMGLYVVVSDVERAGEFYGQLFAKQPFMKSDKVIGFDVAGGLYVLYSKKAHGARPIKGYNAVPYLRVKNIEHEYQRVKAMNVRMIDTRIVEDGPIKLFKFADPDGNIIEFFSVTGAAAN